MLLDHDKPKMGNGGRMGMQENRRSSFNQGGFRRGNDRDDRRGRFSRNSGGPHFPTSRLLEQVKGKYDR
jgi:hypothetical protein